MADLYNQLVSDTPIQYGQVEQNEWINNPLNDVALNDDWAIPSLVSGVLGASKTIPFLPYIKDIWAGKNLLFHKPFQNMTKEEFKDYGNMGKDYYKNYLQNNPINVKGYGLIKFGRKNRGKDKTINYEQYPFLRKNIENATREDFTTNYKNEFDRTYDYFSNTYKGDLYHYLIENIENRGLKYKMMKNKTKGE